MDTKLCPILSSTEKLDNDSRSEGRDAVFLSKISIIMNITIVRFVRHFILLHNLYSIIGKICLVISRYEQLKPKKKTKPT